MAYKGSLVYDQKDFFKKYIEKRERTNSPNELLEKPIIDELIGEIKGKDVLDLGCGFGTYRKEMLENGAKSYHGIDSSEKMLELAKVNLSEFNCRLDKKELET